MTFSQTNPHPKSTLAYPKSTVDLGLQPLIRVENGLIPTPSLADIRPENKGIRPNTNRYGLKLSVTICVYLWFKTRWPSANCGRDAVTLLNLNSSLTVGDALLK